MKNRLSKEFSIWLIAALSMSVLCEVFLLAEKHGPVWTWSLPGTIAYSAFLLFFRVPFEIAGVLFHNGLEPWPWGVTLTSFVYYLILLLPVCWLNGAASHLKRCMSVFFLAVMLLSQMACSTPLVAKLWPHGLGERVVTESSDGVIIDPTRLQRFGFTYTNTWRVTSNDIVEMETRLSQFIQGNADVSNTVIATELPRYKRIYEGRIVAGKRLISVDCRHDSEDMIQSGEWLNSISIVSGGGMHFWRVSYDITNKTFGKIYWNDPM